MELKEIRREIQSVSNIRKLTSALETLSALKMKKAQKIALESRPFAQKIGHLIRHLEPTLKDRVVLRKRPVKDVLVVVVASDRGFCGPFNQNLLKTAQKEIQELKSRAKITVFPIGKKAITYFKECAEFAARSVSGIGDYGTLEEVKPISDYILGAYIGNNYQRVYLVWTDFISTFRQRPRTIQLLPLEWSELKEFAQEADRPVEKTEISIEPSPAVVVQEIIPQLVEYIIYQCILESNASEHSARMTAMRNASDNAAQRVEELTRDYNKVRQEQITREVTEISSAKEVLD